MYAHTIDTLMYATMNACMLFFSNMNLCQRIRIVRLQMIHSMRGHGRR